MRGSVLTPARRKGAERIIVGRGAGRLEMRGGKTQNKKQGQERREQWGADRGEPTALLPTRLPLAHSSQSKKKKIKKKNPTKQNNWPKCALSVSVTWYLKLKHTSLTSLQIWTYCSILFFVWWKHDKKR